MARGVSKNRQPPKEKTGATGSGPAAKPDQQVDTGTIRSSQAELLCAGMVFLAALFLYSWTMAPTVTLVDSGELIVAVHFLGIAHPPGFPLYVMLAHLASLLPMGQIAARINLASGLFAALASGLFTLLVVELMTIASSPAQVRLRSKENKVRPGKKSSLIHRQREENFTRLFVLAPAVGSGLLLASSRTLWAYATVTEVYTLNTLLIVGVAFLMQRWRNRLVTDKTAALSARSSAIGRHDAWLYAAAVIFGLALGVHHVTVALMLPALAVLVYRTEKLDFFMSRRFLYAALFSFASLVAVYSYLPLAASSSPILNWGNPRTLQAIWWHITGRQYQAFFSFTPQVMAEQFTDFSSRLLHEFGPRWLPLVLTIAGAGFWRLFKYDRTTFWFLVTLLLADLVYGLGYVVEEDKDAYYLPAFISIAIAAAFGLRWVMQDALSSLRLGQAYLSVTLLVLLLPAIALATNWPFNNRRHYFIAHDYIQNILKPIGRDGLLLTRDWEVQSPALYTREVEGRRRDVKLVDINLLRRLWYYDYLERAYPLLLQRSRDKVDAFVSELRQWEHDPDAYAKSQALTQAINARFQDMLQSFVTKELEIGPVYFTFDLLYHTSDQDKPFSVWLQENYRLIPRGLVFGLTKDSGFQDPGELQLQTRGLADDTVRFEEDDVVNLKVLPAYTTMLVNRGRYLALFDKHERAIEAFKQALALDPNLRIARQGLEESEEKLRSRGADGR